MQVELAHLEYQKSRLVRSWTHLERQRGGFGFLGGPGETQIETDRRLIEERMRRIEHDLDKVKRTRGLHRKTRRDVPYPVVALVGYTNAGKSTLFNRLTRAEVIAQDMLFATLDPTLRQIRLPHGARALLSDTVGFISDLPTMLMSAFRATLEEVTLADVVLHVRDVSHEDYEAQGEDVEKILEELGLTGEGAKPIIEVWNKIDALDANRFAGLQIAARGREIDERPILVSALTGDGLDALLSRVETELAAGRETLVLTLEAEDGQGLAWAYAHTGSAGPRCVGGRRRAACRPYCARAPRRVDAAVSKGRRCARRCRPARFVMQWFYLAIAILSEVVGTTALRETSAGARSFWPWLIVVLGYGVSFYFISLTLDVIPLGVAYAIWSGVSAWR